MVQIPAVCNNCGTVFGSGFAFENVQHLALESNYSGGCPKCGGGGPVISGIFNVSKDVIEVLSAPQAALDVLSRLAGVVKQAQRESADVDTVVSRIETQVPELRALLALVPRDRNELYAFLAVVLAVIALCKPPDKAQDQTRDVRQETRTNISVNQVFNTMYSTSSTSPTPSAASRPKPPRLQTKDQKHKRQKEKERRKVKTKAARRKGR